MEPTPEAAEWLRRSHDVMREGKWSGVVEICPKHLRPMGHHITGKRQPIGGINTCGCPQSPNVLVTHGLESIKDAFRSFSDRPHPGSAP